jgi:hypothetical protein
MSISVYFTCVAGTKYRVYDTVFAGGKHEQRPVGDPAATARIFVPNGGMKRSYTFKRGDARILANETLEKQLRAAEYLPSEIPDTSQLTPGARPR